jgi:hypothetical protein|tara:strand:+ start:2097 stop:3179 length:1083 start_codon:yes stop_codon:yes gene_type:complete
MNILTSSRSHYQCYINSPRLYYIEYHALGQGIVPKVVNPDLALGTFCHAVCGDVLGGRSEQESVKEQTDIWNELAQTRGFNTLHNPDMLLALAQGLSKAWIRVRIPQIVEEFDVLAVEKERALQIEDEELQLIIPVRLDAELRHKSMETFHALEMKTTRTKRSYYFERFYYDIQTLMHLWTISSTYETCHSVLMEFLYKGYGLDNGETWYSPFVRGMVKHGVPPYDKTEYETEGKFARRKDWNVFNVWEKFTQDEWAEKVGDKLDGQILNLSVVRSDMEIPNYKAQMFFAHKRIAEGLSKLESCSDAQDREALLNEYFPLAYTAYDHHLIGFDAEEAMELGEYIPRKPHHPLEAENLASQ